MKLRLCLILVVATLTACGDGAILTPDGNVRPQGSTIEIKAENQQILEGAWETDCKLVKDENGQMVHKWSQWVFTSGTEVTVNVYTAQDDQCTAAKNGVSAPGVFAVGDVVAGSSDGRRFLDVELAGSGETNFTIATVVGDTLLLAPFAKTSDARPDNFKKALVLKRVQP